MQEGVDFAAQEMTAHILIGAMSLVLCNLLLLLIDMSLSLLSLLFTTVGSWVRESGVSTTAPKATAMLLLSLLFASTGISAQRGGLTPSIATGERWLDDKGGGGLMKGGGGETTMAAATAVSGSSRQQRRRR